MIQLFAGSTVELNLPGFFGMAKHPNMQKIPLTGFSFVNMLHWQYEIWLLQFTVCAFV
jgi:hypothetical protein